MISVLLPTRGRVKLLEKSIKSLRTNTRDKQNVEILVAVDLDDTDTLEVASDLADKVVSMERVGYSRLNEYYNALSEVAQGDWLVLWNDDAVMITKGWDRNLTQVPKDILVADLQSQHTATNLCCFPAVRKEAVKVVGGFSPHTPHCDSYWQDMGRALNAIKLVDIHLSHNRFDMTGDNNDTTWQESQSGYQTHAYYGQEVQGKIREDINKLRSLL